MCKCRWSLPPVNVPLPNNDRGRLREATNHLLELCHGPCPVVLHDLAGELI